MHSTQLLQQGELPCTPYRRFVEHIALYSAIVVTIIIQIAYTMHRTAPGCAAVSVSSCSLDSKRNFMLTTAASQHYVDLQSRKNRRCLSRSIDVSKYQSYCIVRHKRHLSTKVDHRIIVIKTRTAWSRRGQGRNFASSKSILYTQDEVRDYSRRKHSENIPMYSDRRK